MAAKGSRRRRSGRPMPERASSARKLGDDSELFAGLGGLWCFTIVRGEFDHGARAGEELLRLARERSDDAGPCCGSSRRRLDPVLRGELGRQPARIWSEALRSTTRARIGSHAFATAVRPAACAVAAIWLAGPVGCWAIPSKPWRAAQEARLARRASWRIPVAWRTPSDVGAACVPALWQDRTRLSEMGAERWSHWRGAGLRSSTVVGAGEPRCGGASGGAGEVEAGIAQLRRGLAA